MLEPLGFIQVAEPVFLVNGGVAHVPQTLQTFSHRVDVVNVQEVNCALVVATHSFKTQTLPV